MSKLDAHQARKDALENIMRLTSELNRYVALLDALSQLEDKPFTALRIRDVMERTGYSRPSIYRMVKDGTFPKPVKLSTGQSSAAAWSSTDIEAWLAARFGEGEK